MFLFVATARAQGPPLAMCSRTMGLARRSLGIGLATMSVAAALLLSFAATSEAKTRSTCRAKGSTTLLESSHARVYQAGPLDDVKVYGCVYSTGTRYLLTEPSDCDADMVGPDRGGIRLAGRYVGYAIHFCSEGGATTDGVRVRDLVTGELLVRTSGSPTLRRATGFVGVTDMELKANGSVAWIVHSVPLDKRDQPPEAEEVRKSDRTIFKGPRTTSKVLDAGEQIETRSLTRKGSTISWTNAGVEKSARLK